MNLTQLMQYAHLHKSKIQKETYDLSEEQVELLIENINKLRRIPETKECDRITERNASKFMIDDIMFTIRDILSQSINTVAAEYSMLVVFNFNWKVAIGSYAVGLMNMIVSYKKQDVEPKKVFLSKCIVSVENIFLDNILPERNLFPIKKYAISKNIMNVNLKPLLQKLDLLFTKTTIQEKDLDEVISFLDKKKYDDKIYMNVEVSSKRERLADYLIVRVDVAYKTQMYHYMYKARAEDSHVIDLIVDKLVGTTTKNPIQKLRSYASKKNLPFYEKTYHVPEEYLVKLYAELREAKWQDMGILVYNMKKLLDETPPYSGIFTIQFAVCLEGETFHFAMYIPYHNIPLEIYIEVLPAFYEKKKREFFPDEKYKAIIRRHALNPSIQVKQQDLFLMPFIENMRESIVSQHVENPSNVSSLPIHLKDEILKNRQVFKTKLKQHFKQYPQLISRFNLHPLYENELVNLQKQKQRQQNIQNYVYKHPYKQVQQQNKYRQDIIKERQRLKKQLDEYETPADLIELILTDLNLIDPITSEPIQKPVRSPYNPTGIYQQESIKQWLSRKSLDPISRKEMPTTFQPSVDPSLQDFIKTLKDKIASIMEREEEDEYVKKIKLWKLKQDMEKRNVFQQIIKKK